MSEKEARLDSVRMDCTWTSYMAAAGGVLRAAGMWNEDVHMLMGMTGYAFQFIVHERICQSSVTVYDWMDGHMMAMDRIGVHSEVYQVGNLALNTYEQKQKEALRRIRESIDKGIGVVLWAPSRILEFGIVTGYDDEDGVLYVQDWMCQDTDPLLYENLGKSDVPILFYQIMKSRQSLDRDQMFRSSLQFAVGEWNKPFHVNPQYATGRKGYANMITALEKGDFIDFGLAYLLAVYGDAKQSAAQYLAEVVRTSNSLKGLDIAAERFRKIAERYGRMCELVPFSGTNGAGCTVNREHIPQVLELVKECSRLEEEAMVCIGKVLEA